MSIHTASCIRLRLGFVRLGLGFGLGLANQASRVFHSIAQHVIHVQGHKVKHSNCNNAAADCSISLKVGTEFDHVTAHTPPLFKVNGSRVKGKGSNVKVTA